jgi:hypothetical protein
MDFPVGIADAAAVRQGKDDRAFGVRYISRIIKVIIIN